MSGVAQRWRRLRRIGLGRLATVGVLLIAALLIARFSWSVPLAADAERALYDLRALVAAPRVEQDRRTLLVPYTDATLRDTGRRSPLDRGLLARALAALDAMGAKAIGIDIIFDQRTAEDPQLIAALHGMKTPVFLAFATNQHNSASIRYWQEQFERRFLAAVANPRVRPASVLFGVDPDGVARRWPERPAGLPPLMADALAGTRLAYTGALAFTLPRDAERGRFEALDIGLFGSPAAPALAGEVTGRLVLIGGQITDADQFDTPLTRITHATTSGLELHAIMVAQLLDHHLPAPLPGWLLWLLAWAAVAAGALPAATERRGWPSAALLILPLVAIMGLPFWLAGHVDTHGLPAFGWLVGWLLAYAGAANAARGFNADQRRFAQGALGRYLPKDVAAAILRDPAQLALHGERRIIYALFSDLEGFTKLTDSVPAETIAALLNDYLDRLSSVVLAHGGTLDKFVGDAVVAFWGAPISRPDDGDRALAAAMAMVEAGEAFRRGAPADVPPIGRTRVGLHRGDAIVGNFGGEGRMQYTALGDAMNAASRLEHANKALGTRALVSAEAAAGMTDPPLRAMGRVRLRGRATPVEVFEPAPELSRHDAAEQARLVRAATAHEPDGLAGLRALAVARPGDPALAILCDHLETIDEGGVVALD